jgi:hypothetical protein
MILEAEVSGAEMGRQVALSKDLLGIARKFERRLSQDPEGEMISNSLRDHIAAIEETLGLLAQVKDHRTQEHFSSLKEKMEFAIKAGT